MANISEKKVVKTTSKEKKQNRPKLLDYIPDQPKSIKWGPGIKMSCKTHTVYRLPSQQ